MDDLDTLKINKFDLLSAYIDNEVSLAERKRVEEWLRSDSDCRLLYQQLLQVQRSCQAIPTPPSAVPVEQTVEAVMARIDARRRRVPLWGVLGLAAILLGGVTGLVTGNLGEQFAGTDADTIAGKPLDASLTVSTPELPSFQKDSIKDPIAQHSSAPTDQSQSEMPELLIDIDKPLIPSSAPAGGDQAADQ